MSKLADVVAANDHRASLVAMRDRLAREADDVTWQKHKRECNCVCGMGDGRTLVAILKELRAVEDAIDALPNPERQSKSDDLAAKRAARRSTVAATAQSS